VHKRGSPFIYFMIIITIFSSGCSRHSKIASMPDLGIPDEEMNRRIRLEVPDGWNTFKIGDGVALNVDNISTEPVSFQYDFGAKIFVLQDKKWVEIPNLMKYPEGDLLLYPSQGGPFMQGEADVDPILSDTNQPVTIRIVLIGNIYRDGQITNDQTAAFIDVDLKP
jgi:hypothetical protein